MSKANAPKGRLSFCMTCKKDTETILVRDSGLWGLWPIKMTSRVCKECAKPKVDSKLEIGE